MEDNLGKFFIPKQLKVGFQNRDSTYTGKLGYVIYYDQKGTLRKKVSWENWRRKEIEPLDIENVPTEGFVLNKHAGGYKSGWNYRQSYCRVFDPRGFEFEITIENLLWILDWEDCLHGKGLTGKYCYGWIYDELTLIPCCTEDYKVSQEYSNRMFEETNQSVKDFIPGASYKVKNDPNPFIFIGNLKVQKGLGKGYMTKSFFYPTYKQSYKGEAWSNSLHMFNRTSILCKVADNVMSQEEIDELIHRFNISAYSYEFWNTDNIIESFIGPEEIEKKMRFDHYQWIYDSDSYFGRYRQAAKISDDGQSVLILKPYITFTKHYNSNGSSYSGYSSYSTNSVMYKFMELNTKMQKTVFKDLGRFVNTINKYGYYGTSVFYGDSKEALNSTYPDNKGKVNPKDLEKVATLNDKGFTALYYKTKDGYYSDSLLRLLSTESLSAVSQIATEELKYILLPAKPKK